MGYIGDAMGDYYGVVKGDTRSVDYDLHGLRIFWKF